MEQQMSLSGAIPGLGERFGLSTKRIHYRSQLVAYPYFLISAILFFLQIIFGLLTAAYYIWPTYWDQVLPFNISRSTHLNLLIFWLLLGLMGAAFYFIPEETKSELFSPKMALIQFGILVVAGLGTLFSFWFLQASRGKPFTESPMPWPILIALGVVLFLINVGTTIVRAKRWTAIAVVLFAGMLGLALTYLINFVFFENLTVDYYWWWWIIHLWVEGTWELIAAAVMAYLLIALTGVEASRMTRWLYAEVFLTLATGIIGIGHHYYWIGTPKYWLLWGAVFSAFEPLPIALMVYDTFVSMRHRQVEPSNKVTWYFLVGSAVSHFVGAGLWGFAQTLPQINKWTHGTQITASHGHFAFFGAFGMLVLAAIYYMLPKLKGAERIQETRGKWAFWLMTVGITLMVFSFTIAGVVQTYLYRLVGLDFMLVRTQYVGFWIFFVWLFGLVVFAPGVTIYLWDFFALGRPAKGRTAISAAA